MTVSREERDSILKMLAAGQIDAAEAAQLFDALLAESGESSPRQQNRTLRIWITDMTTRSRKVNMTATLPVSALRVGLDALGSLVPSLRSGRLAEIMRSLETGATGRVMDFQDLENGKRIEIFIEQ